VAQTKKSHSTLAPTVFSRIIWGRWGVRGGVNMVPGTVFHSEKLAACTSSKKINLGGKVQLMKLVIIAFENFYHLIVKSEFNHCCMRFLIPTL
jgi:hypothetical protein